jgi:hypothetical protein
MTCSTASNSGKFAWSGVWIGEGTTLKGITFRLSDFFSIKDYSMNPVSLLPHLVFLIWKKEENKFIVGDHTYSRSIVGDIDAFNT